MDTRRRRIAIDELDRAIVDLSARINATTYELLVLIREFDERGGFLQWGLTNCAEWLHWRCDLSLNAARERVRVAHALKCLPEMSGAMARGVLTYSKARALTRVATRENEEALLRFALSTTAARVEERCRQMRNVRPESTDEARRIHEQRTLRVFRDRERGMMTLTVELPLEQGEVICRALDKAVQDESGNGPEFADSSWHAQQADALVVLAKSYLSGESGGRSGSADTYQIIVHVDQAALNDAGGRADLPVESVRRLSCDGSIVYMTDGQNGEPLNVGRKQRAVSSAIKRALWARDRGCSYPGCTNTHFVDAHHVQHWSRGGETSLENTMLLCSAHHRLVHERGYEIRKDCCDRWYFRRPDGRAVPVCGYQPEDVVDDSNTSAEVYAMQDEWDATAGNQAAVREARVRYRVSSSAH